MSIICDFNRLKLCHIYFGIAFTFRKSFTNFTDGSGIWIGIMVMLKLTKKAFS